MGYAIRLTGTDLIDLDEISPYGDNAVERDDGEQRFHELGAELGELQELCYAAHSEALLVVLQGMDTSGKDGTIKDVFRDVNPQGVRVVSFKVPTPVELGHDFLWRIHQQTPEKGMFAVFNRSQYESVLVERVKELVPPEVWSLRYDQINDFERLLATSGTIVAKFYLHISKDEQKDRLLKREKEPTKAWKLSATDWVDRRSWPDYMAAYQDALNRCATTDAPWYVVPADRKWYRNLAIADALVKTLRPYRRVWLDRLAEEGEVALAAVRAERERAAESR